MTAGSSAGFSRGQITWRKRNQAACAIDLGGLLEVSREWTAARRG